ncbi:MAG: hypothetical protein M1398_01695 [Deltaproteobacteria bacterium]|jgi:hypothetical protein|nr:hypothetical protein [Deltaproteobacteria bacterium]
MTERNLNPQYVLDKAGKKAFVVLPVDQYESLLEDIQTSGIPTAIRPGGLSATVFPNKKGMIFRQRIHFLLY